MRRASVLATIVAVAYGCADGSSENMPPDVAAAPQGFTQGEAVGPSGTPTGMTPTGMTPTGMTPTGMTPTGMTPTGMTPTGMTPGIPDGSEAPVAGMGSEQPEPMPMAGMGGEEEPVEQPEPTTGAVAPTVPEITAECPTWRSGTITFMGLGGIQVEVGQKASGPTAPMVFYWHGTGSFSGEFAGSAGAVHQGAMQEGGILVSFQGSTGGDLLSGTAVFGRGDFELTDQLYACGVRDHNIDPRRVFTTGCSAGGLFAGAMAAMRSSYVAASAPNSGGLTTRVQFQNDYTPALMTMHGAPGVDVVIVDFSQTSATADMAFKSRGGFVINCNHGGRHCGARGLAGDVWEFFKAHPYGVDPNPWEGGLPSGFNGDCEIY